MAQDHNYDFSLLESIIKLNAHQKIVLVKKLKRYFKNNIEDKTVAVWGLSFKPNTDDIREAPAIYIIEAILKAGGKVIAYDPQANQNVRKHFGKRAGLQIADNAYSALEGADALLIATEWSMFRSANLAQVAAKLNTPVVFDGRNMYDLETMRNHGFHYESIGRPAVKQKR
jgi:UDPglucose 6-dehydrogenase